MSTTIPATPPPKTTTGTTGSNSGSQGPSTYGGGHGSSKGAAKGENTPSDFGHRNPDFDGDGKISDAEARVYNADKRSEDSRYTTDSRERIAHEKEVGKNYRAEVTAHTEHIKSQNDNKLHKMFGFSFSSEPPPKPESPF